ncbi:MAG: histidine kinase N-terminal 7TM domain-containing protein, partial [Thermoplasmata archaeon]
MKKLYTITNVWIPIVTVIAGLMYLQAYLVYRDNPGSWTNRYFTILSCLCGTWMLLWVINLIYASKYLGMEKDPYTFIIFLYETQFYLIALVGPFFLLTILDVSGFMNSRNRFKVFALVMLPPLVNIALLTYSIAAGLEWMHVYHGINDGNFHVSQGPLFQYFHVPYNYAMFLFAWAILLLKAVKPRYYLERNQSMTLILGSLFGIIGNILTITGVNSTTGMYHVDTTFLGLAGSTAVFGYAIHKNKLFRIVPEKETGRDVERSHELAPGKLYVTSDENMAYRAFADHVHNGIPGLAFTTRNKEVVQKEYHLKKTPVIRLNGSSGKEALNPKLREHLEMIPHLISDFMDEAEESVVIIHASGEWLDTPVSTNIPKTMFYSTYHLDREFDRPTISYLIDEIRKDLNNRKDSVIMLISREMERKMKENDSLDMITVRRTRLTLILSDLARTIGYTSLTSGDTVVLSREGRRQMSSIRSTYKIGSMITNTSLATSFRNGYSLIQVLRVSSHRSIKILRSELAKQTTQCWMGYEK